MGQEEDWRARESAILALGAISEGCVSGLLGHLTEMIGVLLPKLLDNRPLVRSITCWALSRYSHWVVQAGAELNGPGQQQFDTVIAVRSPFPILTRCSAAAVQPTSSTLGTPSGVGSLSLAQLCHWSSTSSCTLLSYDSGVEAIHKPLQP